MEVINIISLSKFNDGGAAIFTASSKNHHSDIVGATAIIPLVK